MPDIFQSATLAAIGSCLIIFLQGRVVLYLLFALRGINVAIEFMLKVKGNLMASTAEELSLRGGCRDASPQPHRLPEGQHVRPPCMHQGSDGSSEV